MIIRDENRLLISDSLLDAVPDLVEDHISKTDSVEILIAGLEIIDETAGEALAGKVLGFSIESDDSIKLDIHTKSRRAYDFIKKYKTTGLSCRMLYLYFGDDELHMEGPFKISTPKIFDFDQQMSMCTLAIDLIKK